MLYKYDWQSALFNQTYSCFRLSGCPLLDHSYASSLFSLPAAHSSYSPPSIELSYANALVTHSPPQCWGADRVHAAHSIQRVSAASAVQVANLTLSKFALPVCARQSTVRFGLLTRIYSVVSFVAARSP